jgi:solute carrier family 35, member E3
MKSGFLSTLVNTSQFFIIDSTGAVSSTVVGHLKTCLIVALGWVVAQKSVGSESVMGIFLALVGIVL